MHVLIVAASRHGATDEIAQALARQLEERSLDVTTAAPEAAPPIDGYDAVIIGSAIYMGKWLDNASEFIDHNAEQLTARPVWLFSSGPLDNPDTEALPADRVDQLVTETRALGHHVFAGKLDRSELSFGERLASRIVHAPDGDFRDWDDIARWADGIADHLEATARKD